MAEERKNLVRALGAKHYGDCGLSDVGAVPADFENQLRNFVKVFPKDYKKVLLEKKARVGVKS